MHPETTPVARHEKKRRLSLVLTAVAGLVLGGGGVGLGWLLTSSPGDGTPDDITMACEIVGGLGPMADTGSDAGFAQQNRLSAASALALSASTLDPRYEELSDLLRKATDAIASTFDVRNPTTADALRQANDFCAGR